MKIYETMIELILFSGAVGCVGAVCCFDSDMVWWARKKLGIFSEKREVFPTESDRTFLWLYVFNDKPIRGSFRVLFVLTVEIFQSTLAFKAQFISACLGHFYNSSSITKTWERLSISYASINSVLCSTIKGFYRWVFNSGVRAVERGDEGWMGMRAQVNNVHSL